MRTVGDDWDITSSVGTTALLVAAARALASQDDHPLIHDPYARLFVIAAHYRDIDLLDPNTWNENLKNQLIARKVMMAIRTKIIDDAIRTAVQRGVKQLVILASGLDSRAYRLKGLESIKTFEIDRSNVIEFKTTVLRENGIHPLGEYRTIAADLRDNWVEGLIIAGFNPSESTIWVTEGLLRYLPGDAQWGLAQTIEQNSAPGSRWILDISDAEFVHQAIENGPSGISSLIYSADIPSTADLVQNWKVQIETLHHKRTEYLQAKPNLSLTLSENISEYDRFLLENYGFYIADN